MIQIIYVIASEKNPCLMICATRGVAQEMLDIMQREMTTPLHAYERQLVGWSDVAQFISVPKDMRIN